MCSSSLYRDVTVTKTIVESDMDGVRQSANRMLEGSVAQVGCSIDIRRDIMFVFVLFVIPILINLLYL